MNAQNFKENFLEAKKAMEKLGWSLTKIEATTLSFENGDDCLELYPFNSGYPFELNGDTEELSDSLADATEKISDLFAYQNKNIVEVVEEANGIVNPYSKTAEDFEFEDFVKEVEID